MSAAVNMVMMGLINKGFTREQAVFLSRCILAGRQSSSLRDEIGSFGMGKLEDAINDIIDTPPKDPVYCR